MVKNDCQKQNIWTSSTGVNSIVTVFLKMYKYLYVVIKKKKIHATATGGRPPPYELTSAEELALKF